MPLLAAQIIYRWDLDKTYLRTEFDTLRDVLRTAFERPKDKRTVPGAAVLLREIGASGPAGISILSGSPEQMRRVLEAKLRLDGIRWDSFVLKPSLRKLLSGKFRFVKEQLGYKLAALLLARESAANGTHEVLFGDDAEADAYIYSLYADLCAGRVGSEELLRVLEVANVYKDEIPTLVRLAERLPRREVVKRIFIHADRVSSADEFSRFGNRVCHFFNYFQPALVLNRDGAISTAAVLRVATDLILSEQFGGESLFASFADLARRGYVGRECAIRLATAARQADERAHGAGIGAIRTLADVLEARCNDFAETSDDEPQVLDYVSLFGADSARAHAAKRRAKLRAEQRRR